LVDGSTTAAVNGSANGTTTTKGAHREFVLFGASSAWKNAHKTYEAVDEFMFKDASCLTQMYKWNALYVSLLAAVVLVVLNVWTNLQ